ncbi:zinc-ribbon and DUF3426 domain-containing protein [Roseateles sp. P5_E7]
MSLATRCTACGTVFRIVEDQLRVSDGWVRCGRCAEIFDARELLFDIEQEAPPPWPAAFTPEPVIEPPPPPAPPPPPPEPLWMPPPDPEPRAEALPTGWPSEVARQEPRWVDEPREPPSAPPAPLAPLPAPAPLVAEPSATPAAVVPEFMRRAESTARWNRPRVRLALGGASALLALLLALQVTLHFRDALAALNPPLRGTLQGLCGLFGCEVRPWLRPDALKVESTSLTPIDGSNSYKLTLTLSNLANVAVAAPWIDLRLTDASGALLARGAFEPKALSPQLQEIPALSEQSLSFTFRTAGQSVSGYQVDAFYP